MRVVEVHVTEDDIQRGVPGNAMRCPVALATSRATGVKVTVSCTAICDVASFRIVSTPQKVSDWIKNLDRGVKVKPISFRISFPEG